MMNFLRPTKVRWTFPAIRSGENWTDKIPSKSIRKQAQRIEEILAQNKIRTEVKPLTAESYHSWWLYYSETMISQGHDVIATPEWFAQRQPHMSKIWLFEYISVENQRVGASIICETPDNTLNHSFKASNRIDVGGFSNSALGSLMELNFLQFAFQQQPHLVTSGHSRNAFGYYTTIGYFASKLKLGYVPQASDAFPLSHDLPRTDDQSPTIWIVLADGVQQVVCFPSSDAIDEEVKTYLHRQNITLHNWVE